ncbi:hypothetical protein E3T46_15070 [Cryobacterium sp. Hh11]|uniref:hypothetical protein n=1 Tax=Cryobacterium sp. Hh11 TaxID=2555868 RepID=UPI00106A3664|nr:hypothetical protein [Cryobacterium sp. Hh11]TFD48554.1 hypothetical protein E3T46_15070 [Cryobacterium sp. Hh11]
MTDWNDGLVPDDAAASAVNKWLVNADTVNMVLDVLRCESRRVAGGDRLGTGTSRNRVHVDRRRERRAAVEIR